jgi:hypothetical protein
MASPQELHWPEFPESIRRRRCCSSHRRILLISSESTGDGGLRDDGGSTPTVPGIREDSNCGLRHARQNQGRSTRSGQPGPVQGSKQSGCDGVALKEPIRDLYRCLRVRVYLGPAVLLAFVLIAAQLHMAMHDAHDLAGGGDRATCAICLLGHGLDGAVAPAMPKLFEHPEQAPVFDAVAIPDAAVWISAYRARGPPSRDIRK